VAAVSIEDGTLVADMRLWDKILAVHGSLRIPLSHVRAAKAGPAPPIPWFRKVVGTDVPWVIAAGTFLDNRGWAFYDYRANANCLMLDLEHEFYKVVVIEIDPPQTAVEAAEQITAALAELAGAP
jgi:hypothetical protein